MAGLPIQSGAQQQGQGQVAGVKEEQAVEQGRQAGQDPGLAPAQGLLLEGWLLQVGQQHQEDQADQQGRDFRVELHRKEGQRGGGGTDQGAAQGEPAPVPQAHQPEEDRVTAPALHQAMSRLEARRGFSHRCRPAQ